MNPIDVVIDSADAVALFKELAASELPVDLTIAGVCDTPDDDMVVEFHVNHQEDHVPQMRLHLHSDGTWTAQFKLVPEDTP